MPLNYSKQRHLQLLSPQVYVSLTQYQLLFTSSITNLIRLNSSPTSPFVYKEPRLFCKVWMPISKTVLRHFMYHSTAVMRLRDWTSRKGHFSTGRCLIKRL
ncbi:hypothetical protein P3L10_020574 [Capsicum annuum]|uniref:uncharacterized protein LOC107877993 n=1 Tax=Capsicum annuum TaxID=4072 RepID=UPI0007BFB95E|nr:uncharacterized protein LOC107877993 [Capsicum annuum]